MGRLSFQSFFVLPSGYWGLRIIILKTSALIPFAGWFLFERPLPVAQIYLRIERLSVFEHTINDPKDFVRATDFKGSTGRGSTGRTKLINLRGSTGRTKLINLFAN